MFEGRLDVVDGPSWRHRGVDVASIVNAGDGPLPATVIIRTGSRTWTISRTQPDQSRKNPVSELGGTSYQLSTESQDPAVWTEDLDVGQMRRALTDHVGVGLGWSDRWRLANATARALPLMYDLVTERQRYELRPRFDAVAYPSYPSPVESSVPGGATARLILDTEVVGEGAADFFRAIRPMPAEVALLASFLIFAKGPEGASRRVTAESEGD